mmetsp:Transcript_21440/g.34696  ORF Transcript_21440/g.34696 Transcript_21440/m.34696 type:complete len:287 (+) Transcript_21440:281-1141(+)
MASAMYGKDKDERGGFNFDHVRRNNMLHSSGLQFKAAMKTGTTISGIVFKDGVVLGADTRSTNGDTVADKNCEKIHYIAPNIYCCGAGTAADTEAVTGMIASNLELHRMATKRQSRVITSLTMLKTHLFKYQGQIGAALVLGGFDLNGPHLFTVYPHGSSDALPFATMGSGSLAAMAVFESDYREGLDEEEAKELVARSIRAGIFNDLGSGSNVDLCVITKDGVKYLRNHETPNKRTYARTKGYDFPPGTTVLNRRNFMTATAATLPLNEIVDISNGAPEDVVMTE